MSQEINEMFTALKHDHEGIHQIQMVTSKNPLGSRGRKYQSLLQHMFRNKIKKQSAR